MLLNKHLLKVLLVDDEATDRIPVERILRNCSSPAEFVVESVVNLSEAIKKLTEKQYDVVLLDLELPDSSGIEILQQVVKVAPDIPVVVLTELDDEQTGFSALEDGATDYLVKDLPLDVVLVRTIVYAMQRKKIQMQSLKLAHDNNERMKELNCLYGISKLVETPGISLEEILEKTVRLIPAGWQYPDIACARIVFEGKEYKTDNFKPSKWTQSADITLQGQKVGTVEVGYMEERPQFDEGPFLEEKRDLIDATGEQLGKMAERFKVEEALREKSVLLAKVINSVPDFIFAKDTKLRTIICNEAYASAVGKKPEEMIGHTDIENGWDAELVCGNPAKGIRGFENDDRDALSGKTIHNPYDPANTPNGVLIFDTYKMPLRGKDGEIIGMLGIARDITESEKAEETQKRLVALIEATPDFVGFADAKDKHIIYVNKAGRKMCGIGNDEDVTKLKISDLHPEWTNKMFAEEIMPAAVRDGVWTGECAFLNIRDRHEIPVSMVLSSHKTSNGEVEVFSTISRDITERKKVEETLRESERKKHAFFDQTFQLIGLTTTDGILIEANKTALEFSGIEASSVLNKPFWQGPWWAHSPELQEKLRQAVEKAARGESICFEATHVDKDGMLHYVDFSLKPVKNETGKVIFLIPEGRDITERKKAEEALRESEERYKNLFMANIDGMLVADATTKKFRYANPAICRMLGYSEEELTQMGVADIHPKESFEQVIAEFEAQTSGAKITAKDLQCVRKDGQIISVSINAGTVMIDQTKYLLGIFRDVTERKNKEKQDFS